MRSLSLFFFFLSQLLYQPTSQSDKIVKQTFDLDGQSRSYYIFVPEKISAHAPLLLVLHGSNMDGRSIVEEWKEIARKEGFIVVGPDSLNPAGWSLETDGPGFIYALVEALKAKYQIDARRVYLFGYSAGAVYALQLSMLESEYFAATAVYAGAMDPTTYNRVERAKRKIAVALFVGTDDPFFPVPKVKATRNELKRQGFPVYMKEFWIDDSLHGHDYHSVAGAVNRESWRFLKGYQLEGEAKFKTYQKEN